MADIKSMFSKMMNGNGSGDAPAAPAPKSKGGAASIEKTYQKKTQLEHILLRPDTYIGSVEHVTELMWVYDTEKNYMVQKQVTYCPGLYKIFDEILVNAADNKQRDKNMDCIKIDINQETNTVSIWNNGKGIPVVMHKEENMFVPTMIFGHLLTSSNYDDAEEKVVGGRNGYGAKLCNIFSTKFTVETASREFKKQFKQTWGNNMTKSSEPKIKPHSGEEFTKISFSPDLVKFHMDKLDDDIVGLMSRRAYDIAASTRGVKVMLNGERIKVKGFKDYIDLYVKSREDEPTGPPKIVYENVNDRWEVAVTISERGFQQVSFVNSIATSKGGRHVDYVTDMIVKQLIEILKKKNRGGINIKPFQVKNHMWVFINCLIVNPAFDSQTKENMTTVVKKFGSKCDLNEKFITNVSKSGIVETVLSWAKFKAQTELNKQSGKKQCKLKGVPKLEDANDAGTKNAHKCTLILTEGDSAKCLAVSGLGVVGRDHFGVFPLRGKLLNVREATHKQILDNAEINTLIKIIGLQYKMKYKTPEELRTLRYGKVMIMTDQDQDGSHIKGLIINFVHHFWPELLHHSFLEIFITPIVKVTKKNIKFSFYSLPEFDEWKLDTADYAAYSVKYYKGLGTSTSQEAKEYFKDMERHRIALKYSGADDDRNILLAFSKKEVDSRKDWLLKHNEDLKQRKELGLPEVYLYTKETRTVTYTDYVQKELVYFSNGDNVRSIPSLIDGLKPGQRKVLFTCIKRNDKREVKVAQLAGSVAETSAYHHGEVSLCMTIVNLAQNYIGSNNINLLEPRGQFGTRLNGGKDSASARYIFTKMSPLTRLIFHPHDDPLLRYETDDNQKIEPFWYIPIIPMVLVNGADGIGTGWRTKIPNYNPREIVTNILLMLDDQEPKAMHPWYKNFKGSIEYCGEQKYVCNGEVSITDEDLIEITELPVGTWTQVYKENVLENLVHGSEKVKATIQDYKEYSTDTTVKFVVTALPGQLRNMENEGLHANFKLQSSMAISNMVLFDEFGGIKKYESVDQILREFFTVRMRMYVNRKEFLENNLEAEVSKLTYQAKFIVEKCSGKIVVENKQRKTMVDELIKRGYPADPVKEWKEKIAKEMYADDEPDKEQDEEDQEIDETDTKNKGKEKDPEKSFGKLSEVKKYDYLLGMSMWMLTNERKNQLLKQRDDKIAEMTILREKKPSDLWREDLDVFSAKLDEVERKERLEESQVIKKEVSKTKGGRKQKAIIKNETLPSPAARRIEPRTEEFKEKVAKEAKAKVNKIKKKTTTLNVSDEKDEFDMLADDKKSLKDKLGNSPEKIEEGIKKKRAPNKSKTKPDGMVQTKLNFKKGSPKGKKKLTIDTDESVAEVSSGSEADFDAAATPSRERTARRAATTRKVSYKVDIESDKSDDSEPELFDNDLVKEEDEPDKIFDLSDSEDDGTPKSKKPTESNYDVKPVIKLAPTTNKKSKDSSDDTYNEDDDDDNYGAPKSKSKKTIVSDDGFGEVKTKPKAAANKKKSKHIDFHDNDDNDIEKKPKSRAPASKKKSKYVDSEGSDSNDDNDREIKPKPRATASKKKSKYVDSEDDDFTGDEIKPKPRATANKKKSKFIDSEDGDFNDDEIKPKPRAMPNKKKTKYIDSEDDNNGSDDDDFGKSKGKKQTVDSDDDDFSTPVKNKEQQPIDKSSDELFDSLFEPSDSKQNTSEDLDNSDISIAQKMAGDKRKANLDDGTNAKKIKTDRKR